MLPRNPLSRKSSPLMWGALKDIQLYPERKVFHAACTPPPRLPESVPGIPGPQTVPGSPGGAPIPPRGGIEDAMGSQVPLWLDMEDATYVDRTLDLYRRLLLRAGPRVGICLQAYLHRTPMDLAEVLAAGGRIRLVKGAYRASAAHALQDRAAVDGAFLVLPERLAREPLTEPGLRHVLGTHDPGLLERLGLGPTGNGPPEAKAGPPEASPSEAGSPEAGPPGADPNEGGKGSTPADGGSLSVQMLYGIQEDAWDALVRRDVPFRVLISYGARWYPWFMRRLAERPSNLRFVLGRN